ncbi:MAG TPA: hypothetical protein VMF89_03050 [Polyangiales bacterium]|nr:hypothetical protein [Polyangiales bacterium]
MNQAPVRQNDAGIPYLEPDSEEPQTNPRIRVQPLLAPEHTGMVRLRAGVQYAQRALSRLKLAPAIVLGAVLGSAPYLVQQHVRARVIDEPRILTQAPAAQQETSQLAAATPPPQPTQEPPAPLPPPSADEEEEYTLPPPTRIAPERALLMQAKRQLRHGDGFGAQLVLQRLAKRVPHGKLMRQRKLLEIEVLQAIGAKAAARRAASDFAKAYPQSRELSKLSALLLGS